MRPITVRAVFVATFAVASVLGLAPPGQAVVLLPGSGMSLGGTTVGDRPELAGGIEQDNLIPFTITDGMGTPVFRGTVQDRVVRSTSTGTLIFAFVIRNTDPTLPGCIVGVSRSGFGRRLADADYRTDAGIGPFGPDVAWRTGSGNEVDFGFGDNCISSGGDSWFVFVLTDATTFYQRGTITLYADDGSSVLLACAAP